MKELSLKEQGQISMKHMLQRNLANSDVRYIGSNKQKGLVKINNNLIIRFP